MSTRYIIYYDESDIKGEVFSHFYGGALIDASKQQSIESELQKLKHELNIFDGEMKWQRITDPYKGKYIQFEAEAGSVPSFVQRCFPIASQSLTCARPCSLDM